MCLNALHCMQVFMHAGMRVCMHVCDWMAACLHACVPVRLLVCVLLFVGEF